MTSFAMVAAGFGTVGALIIVTLPLPTPKVFLNFFKSIFILISNVNYLKSLISWFLSTSFISA